MWHAALTLTFLAMPALVPMESQTTRDTLPDVSAYPRPLPIDTVARAPEIPRLRVEPGGVDHHRPGANEAVRLQVLGGSVQAELFGERAPEGHAFLVLLTRWENIHPKRPVHRASLEGRPDRSMGVAGFAGGESGAREYVDVDVAYQVPRLADHLFALVEGTAVPLHPVTGTLPRGRDPGSRLTLPRLGSTVTLPVAFQVPAGAENVALQFFDYTFGNVIVPVRGRAEPEAVAKSTPVLARAETDELDVAATRLEFRDRYGERAAPQGWRWAMVGLRGQSRSAGGGVGNIVQLEPNEYAFLMRDGGYLRYAAGGSVDERGMIRFTPDVPQGQELAFLVPEEDTRFSLGLRLRNTVVTLRLTNDEPRGLPAGGAATHRDGDVLEVILYGIRREGEGWIADLAVRPLVENRGLTLRADAQFRLVSGDEEVPPDLAASQARPGGPPSPFIAPPGTAVRFELVYPSVTEPTGVRYRGFRGEGMLKR